jgi:hypothetical protein
MPTTRRGFVQQSLTVAGCVVFSAWIEVDDVFAQGGDQCALPDPGTAVSFVPNEPKVLTRYSTLEMADAGMSGQLTVLRDAFCRLQKLPPTDVIGWDKQIAQHCINCARSFPANIHYYDAFVTWHRGMLYFLERILRNLSGHDELRLAYWNWEDARSRTVPAIYQPSGQCLYWANRHLGTLTPSQVDVQALLAIPDFPTFGGGSQPNQPGAVFGGPHAKVHNAFAPGDMADLQYSPRDPVFYAHHSNIDRLWTSWVKAGHANPDFGEQKVYFYDESRKWRSVLFNDLKDESRLGYQYSSYMQPKANIQNLENFALQGNKALFTMEADVASKVTSRQGGPSYLIIKNIHNLEKLPAATGRYGIFSGEPGAAHLTAEAGNFLGDVADVRAGGKLEHQGPLTAALDVSGKLGSLLGSNRNRLNLTVAALEAGGEATGPSIPLEADSISIIE